MADIESLIVKAKPAAPSKFIVMGDPFTGKTTIASKAPKPLFISTDGNAAKAGLDAINANDLQTVREAINYFVTAKDYETLVIDTVEGIADLLEASVISKWNKENGTKVTALTDVAYGRLTGQFNNRLASFSESLLTLPKNVIVLTYTKRQIDDVSGSLILGSELKGIRRFTRFADGLILTSYDGERYRAEVISKRTIMAGEVKYGDIEPFLTAAGWELRQKKIKVGGKK